MAAMKINKVNNFDIFLEKLSVLVYSKTTAEKDVLKELLAQYSNDYFASTNISIEKTTLAVNHCCYLVNVNETAAACSVLKFFRSLLSPGQAIKGKTQSTAVNWAVDCLTTENREQICLALAVLPLLCGTGISSFLIDKIITACEEIIAKYGSDRQSDIILGCLDCIQVVASNLEENIEKAAFKKFCDFSLNLLYRPKRINNELWRSKALVLAIRVLETLVQRFPDHIVPILPDIVGVVKGYMLYQLPGFENCIVEKIQLSNLSIPDKPRQTKSDKKPLGKYERNSKKKAPTSITDIADTEESSWDTRDPLRMDFTSDSDFSDGENGRATRLRINESKVRRCALILFASLLLKEETREIMRYLPSMLPDGSNSRNIITCLISDPSSSCRSEALIVLSLVLSKFKPFFVLADSCSSSSFTSLANTVATMLVEIHSSLILALMKENYNTVTLQILRTISDLIRCTPYHKIKETMITPLSGALVTYLTKGDLHLRIATLVNFGCIMSINPKSEEVRRIVCRSENGRPWLLNQCLGLLSDENFNSALAIECLQVLTALVRNFPRESLINRFEDVISVMEFTSEKYDKIIRLYAAKLVEASVLALQSCVVSQDQTTNISVALTARMWDKIIVDVINPMIQCDCQPALRAIACDCLAYLACETGETGLVYDELPRNVQILTITNLLGCCRDEDPKVRSSAVRALAPFVQFSRLREDSLFLLDEIDVFFRAAGDENEGVKLQATWLYRHLCESILANRNDGLDDDITDTLLFRLINTGAKLAKEVKKGKPYSFSGIASLLSILPEEKLSEHRAEITQCVDILVQNASTGSYMKDRWNACFALSTALVNPALSVDARLKVFPVLFELVKDCRNFKVRISASQALCSLPSRESYCDCYISTYRALLSGLENVDNATDVYEYKYREQLIDKICSGLCYLLSVISLGDLQLVYNLLRDHYDLSNHFTRFRNRIVPEKASVILKASKRLTELLESECKVNNEQRNALLFLNNMLSLSET